MATKTKVTVGTALALAAGLTYYNLNQSLVVPLPPPQKKGYLWWSHPEPNSVIFEIGFVTNLDNPIWTIYTNITGTTTCNIPTALSEAYWTILRTIDTANTNLFSISQYYTNQYYKTKK